jgi:predicted GNAT family acetyltransferase
MDIQEYKKAADFLTHTKKYLNQNEARYGLVVGIAKRLVDKPHYYGQEDPWFCSVQEKGVIHAITIRTPPFSVIVLQFSGAIETIADALVGAVLGKYQKIPGAVGDKGLVDVFVKRWCEKTGNKIKDVMAQRIYRLDKVNDVPVAPGRFRAAKMEEIDLVKKWFHGFHVDIGAEMRGKPENDITPALEVGNVFFWEDGQPVSMAAKTHATDKGMTVGGVYTPPELRSKGYATSCVAELSRNILRSGKEFCMLYTDLANPTSNSIYKKMGYKEVADSVQYTFDI